jgi:ATP-dependent Clp endopeptidase proteolytic subunit ClpP
MAKSIRTDIDVFFDYGLHVSSRTIYIGSVDANNGDESGVDSALSERTTQSLHVLDLTEGPIKILLNNPGGDEYHGIAIYDAIKACKNHVEILVMGHAMSMGSIILQAGDTRVMSPNARLMIHYGTWGFDGHAKSAAKWAEEGKELDRWMEEVYLTRIKEKNPTFSRARLQGMLNFDTFMGAAKAVELGLADSIKEPV